jgi:iron complex outermembrane receptor protein
MGRDITYLAASILLSGWMASVEGKENENDSLSRVFELGEVRILAEKQSVFTPTLDMDDLEKNMQGNVARSMPLLPGVHFMQAGQKNEAMVHVRGFDLRQVPVLLDGVPVYISYDGYTDLGRFLTADLSRISVSRGETSLMAGPNAMGGAINLVSRKPVSPLELDASAGILLDDRGYGGNSSHMNLGTRQERYYLQAGLAFLENEDLVLPGGAIEPNSAQRDLNASFKAGFTPNATDTYVLSAHYLQGEKGVPWYRGADPFQRKRFWQFPSVRKTGIHFNSQTGAGEEGMLRMRVFLDQYFSELESYDDSTFTSRDFGSSFTSIYNDITLGGNIQYQYTAFKDHDLSLSVHGLYDHHREHNTYPREEPVRHFRDLTLSIAVEDVIRLAPGLEARAGLGWYGKANLQADNFYPGSDSIASFPVHDDQAMNALGALRYEFGEGHRLGLHLSRKTRFPTMKDRYSYRLGRSLPNPDLRSEASWNSDLSYVYSPGSLLRFRTSLFYNQLQNTIQAVYGIDPDDSGVYQFRNTGSAQFYGWENDLRWVPLEDLEINLQYIFTERENLDQPDLRFTNLPKHKIHGRAAYTLFSRWKLEVGSLYNSNRISSSNGEFTTDPFMVFDFYSELILIKGLVLDLAVNNILDTRYSYTEGYLAPGRQFRLGLRYRYTSGNSL